MVRRENCSVTGSIRDLSLAYKIKNLPARRRALWLFDKDIFVSWKLQMYKTFYNSSG